MLLINIYQNNKKISLITYYFPIMEQKQYHHEEIININQY